MKLSGSYTVPVLRERAYALLQDPAILAQCMPGTDHLDKVGDNDYQMKMKLAIASVSGLFTGRVKITDTQPPESFRLNVEGDGKIGFLKGGGLLNLSWGENDSTRIDYDGDVQVGGTVAAMGQRLIETTAKMMIKRFFEKFAEISAQIQ